MNNGLPCSSQFAPEDMVRRRLEMAALVPRDQMLALLGKISCTINMSEETCRRKKSSQAVRQHQRTLYYLESRQICQATFKFIHGISQGRLTGLLKWYKSEGLAPKEKRSGGRNNNRHCLQFSEIEDIVRFLTNYASEHAMILPGRVPGFKRDDIKLLPSSHTKTKVYDMYKSCMEQLGKRVAGLSSFKQYWLQLVPFIVTSKPMTDLCWTCQNNNTLIYRSANIEDNEKGLISTAYGVYDFPELKKLFLVNGKCLSGVFLV